MVPEMNEGFVDDLSHPCLICDLRTIDPIYHKQSAQLSSEKKFISSVF